MNLPSFTYHPDPIRTGRIIASDEICRSCGQSRGYVYAGAPYAVEELEEALCPWCIADGSAATKLHAEFVDAAAVGDYGRWEAVPDAVVDEIAHRTPGFAGWQQERWWTHCGDAAVFLGTAGRRELEAEWPDAIEAVRTDAGFGSESGTGWDGFYAALSRDHGPTAYVFRCRHCGQFGAYTDTD